jgi:hypothetical protein
VGVLAARGPVAGQAAFVRIRFPPDLYFLFCDINKQAASSIRSLLKIAQEATIGSAPLDTAFSHLSRLSCMPKVQEPIMHTRTIVTMPQMLSQNLFSLSIVFSL